jgi:hypothetical protein
LVVVVPVAVPSVVVGTGSQTNELIVVVPSAATEHITGQNVLGTAPQSEASQVVIVEETSVQILPPQLFGQHF